MKKKMYWKRRLKTKLDAGNKKIQQNQKQVNM